MLIRIKYKINNLFTVTFCFVPYKALNYILYYDETRESKSCFGRSNVN